MVRSKYRTSSLAVASVVSALQLQTGAVHLRAKQMQQVGVVGCA